MPGTATTLPTLVPYADWLQKTSLPLIPRERLLCELDDELFAYERNPTPFRFSSVQEKLKQWQNSCQPPPDAWKKHSRNKNSMFTLLDQQLRGLGDTDTAMGVPAFMEAGMINARLGIVYLFAHLRAEDSIFKIALEGAFDVTTAGLELGEGNSAAETASTVLGGAQGPAGWAAAKLESKLNAKGTRLVSSRDLMDQPPLPPPRDPAQMRMLDTIKEKLQQVAEKVFSAIKDKFASIRADPGAAALENLPGLLRKLVNFLASTFLAAAAPFISAGLDIAKGVANTVDAGIDKFREWLAGGDVQVLAGHPGTIVEAIRRAMWFSVGQGLYETLKGGLDLGLQFATQGASALVSVLVSIIEVLVKTIWKIVEVMRINSFCRQAQAHWQGRNEASALHNQPIQFNNWFKRYAVDIPALAVLALNTGICGDKMRFLCMFRGDSSVVSQAEFDAGCRYVDSLKVWGSEYLEAAGFSFASDDPMTNGLLTLATSHKVELTGGGKAWKFILGFLN